VPSHPDHSTSTISAFLSHLASSPWTEIIRKGFVRHTPPACA